MSLNFAEKVIVDDKKIYGIIFCLSQKKVIKHDSENFSFTMPIINCSLHAKVCIKNEAVSFNNFKNVIVTLS